MRARTRLFLDISLLIALVAVYKPAWTGITLHEWLAIAAIVPLLLHFTVNWDWAVRVARTFVERLLHASRLNFLVDCLLMVATVAAMVSGVMVTPALTSLLGLHPVNPFAWHVTHSMSANATIALLLLHTALHWRFLGTTTGRLIADMRPPARARRTGRRVPARVAASRAVASEPCVVQRRSRVGVRAAEAARERAMARRVISVLGLTAALSFAVLAGVGAAGPLLRSSASARHVAAGTLVCPKTGCTASTCHAGSGLSPKEFYARAAAGKGGGTRVAKAGSKHRSRTRVARAKATRVRSAAPKAVASAAPKAARRVTAAVAPKPVKRVVRRRFVCPVSGCVRSSCHATYGKSASSFYH